MKRLFLTAALGVVCVSASGQGSLNFANGGVGVIARVYDTDGVTGLAGSAWSADLYWALGVVTDSTLLTPLNQPATFSTVPVQAGLFFGGPRTVPTPGGLEITAQVRVWDTASGSSWAAASTVSGARIGESILFPVELCDIDLLNPCIPTTMTALNGHPWSVQYVHVGTVVFANYGTGWNAKVTDTDGVTGLSGSAWSADLYWAPGIVTNSTLLTALNQPATFSTIPEQAGYFSGGVRTIPTLPQLTTLQVRVWDTASGSSWAAAVKPGARVGESMLFQVKLADAGDAEIPPSMNGLDGHPWSVQFVPEPFTLNFQVSGGNLVLLWSQGVLQSSSEINGTYIDINATSPYNIPLGAFGYQQFYRLRIP
jgi:hypothetical protein